MTNRARIEYLNQFGEWRYFTAVTQLGRNVENALDAALRSQNCVGRARAIDESSGSVVDVAAK